MSKEEYRQLELLLDKLEIELGNKICIIPSYAHDGYYINMYCAKRGLSLKSATSHSIESTVELLKQPITNDTTGTNKG